ncbi:MAG: hypothetical protein AAB897_02560 [Patescibacteria group bacterium]
MLIELLIIAAVIGLMWLVSLLPMPIVKAPTALLVYFAAVFSWGGFAGWLVGKIDQKRYFGVKRALPTIAVVLLFLAGCAALIYAFALYMKLQT